MPNICLNSTCVLQYHLNISQGSVWKRLRCGGIVKDRLIADLLLSVTVKEF